MLTLREQFITAFDAFVASSQVAESTLSDRLLKSGTRFRRIRAGSDISTGTFERAMQWLSDNWPEGAVWPEGVERPSSVLTRERATPCAPDGRANGRDGRSALPPAAGEVTP